MKKERIKYLISFILLLAIEVCIALYVHDRFVRPYIGDVLVVVVIYCLLRVILPEGIKGLPLYIFLFAALVELLQYFRLVEQLGLQNNTFLRIVIGSTFDIKDILCYAVGCALLRVYEIIFLKNKRKKDK